MSERDNQQYPDGLPRNYDTTWDIVTQRLPEKDVAGHAYAEPTNTPPITGNHRPRVYICSPYRGDTVRNVEYARRMCRRAFERGLEPVAPHLYYPQWLDDDEPDERAYGMRRGLELMAGCREVWVCGAVITEGMRAEMEEAERLGITDIRV